MFLESFQYSVREKERYYLIIFRFYPTIIMNKTKNSALFAIFFTLLAAQSFGFVIPTKSLSSQKVLFSTTQQNLEQDNIKKLTLEKPLGLILEEVEEDQPKGVYVCEISDEGSASEYEDILVGKKLLTVMDQDVRNLIFDDVMDKLINAPSPVSVEFLVEETMEEEKPEYDIGTEVTVVVLNDDGTQTSIEARVGDNLRKTLLDNNVEVYKGLKKKLGNCGGKGYCVIQKYTYKVCKVLRSSLSCYFSCKRWRAVVRRPKPI